MLSSWHTLFKVECLESCFSLKKQQTKWQIKKNLIKAIWHGRGCGVITFLLLWVWDSSLCFQHFELLGSNFHAFSFQPGGIQVKQLSRGILTWVTWLQTPTKITRTGENLRLSLLWTVPFSEENGSACPQTMGVKVRTSLLISLPALLVA